ncbi:YcjX family protein [Glaesserella parasuis]|nr:YcjX family protein [Glaesserella parasuis]
MQRSWNAIYPTWAICPAKYRTGRTCLSVLPLLDLSENEWEQLEKSPEHSIFHTLKKRYRHYQQKIVKPFYEDYFSQFDRQVILADCLTPLNHSHQAFIEMKTGLQQLFKHFHYGNRSLFSRLFSSNIDKLLFVATKADHITSDQLPNLESLMRQLVQEGGDTLNLKALIQATKRFPLSERPIL